MQDGRADKEAKGDQYRNKDDQSDRAHADTQDAGKRVAIAHEAERTHQQAEEEIDNESNTAADHSIDERLAQSALGFHGRESGGGIEQDEFERFDEGGEKAELLAAIPRQAGRRNRYDTLRVRRSPWEAGSRPAWRGVAGAEIHLCERQPVRHAFAPG